MKLPASPQSLATTTHGSHKLGPIVYSFLTGSTSETAVCVKATVNQIAELSHIFQSVARLGLEAAQASP
jgi:hypothetical protein